MAHEIAKLLLEHAETFLERTEAIRAALSLGMPLEEIEEYLDWLDAMRGQPRDDASDGRSQTPRTADASQPADQVSLEAAKPPSSEEQPPSPADMSPPAQDPAAEHPGRPEPRPSTES